jgi:hypothetical protein
MHLTGLTTALDDRHFGLLTLIVLMWAFWFWCAWSAEWRTKRGSNVVVCAGVAVAALLIISPWIALGAVQWMLAAGLGVLIARATNRRRDL